MEGEKPDQVRRVVRDRYGKIAEQKSGCGCAAGPSCCGNADGTPEGYARALGYRADEIESMPVGANMGLGCGNPLGIASIKTGEVVLDLGSGGGFDCFIAAKAVGESGRVIGVDMTPEMVSKARENAVKVGQPNVEFRLGEIEHLPMADASVDVVISNCVVNLSPDKPLVFREIFRVLKPGGRIAISDIVATAELPVGVRENLEMVAGCVGGAEPMDALQDLLDAAGFEQIRINPRPESRVFIRQWFPDADIEDAVVSATIEAVKPDETFGSIRREVIE